LSILRAARVQLPEVGKRVRVVVLLEISETNVQQKSGFVRTDSKCALIDLDGARVAMGVRVDDAEIAQNSHVAGICFEKLAESGFGSFVVAGFQGGRSALEDFLVGIGLGSENSWHDKDYEDANEYRRPV
jgi:hypothetical protein